MLLLHENFLLLNVDIMVPLWLRFGQYLQLDFQLHGFPSGLLLVVVAVFVEARTSWSDIHDFV